MTPDIFQKQIIVRAEHLDAINHVNNIVYLQWVQDIGSDHWLANTKSQYEDQYFWVVLDHFIEYKGQAFLDDILTVKTFIKSNDGVRSVRIVEFFKEEKLICRASSNWCLIDRKRNRPVRISKEINDLFLFD